jgi:hypothetical protein
MAKQGGMGDRFALGAYDLSGDIQALSRIGGGPAALDVTAINKSAFERLGGIRTGGMAFTSYFNPAAGAAHPRLGSLPVTDVIATYGRGSTIGAPAASQVSKQIGYDPTRGQDGSLTASVAAESNGFGIEWGSLLTAWPRADASATNGAGVDFLVPGSFGLQAYLHVFSFTGTSVTIKLQQSSDNGGGDAFADVTGGGFTLVTGLTSERIATSGVQAVEQYLRVVTTGTFSAVSFVVMATVNATATAF